MSVNLVSEKSLKPVWEKCGTEKVPVSVSKNIWYRKKVSVSFNILGTVTHCPQPFIVVSCALGFLGRCCYLSFIVDRRSNIALHTALAAAAALTGAVVMGFLCTAMQRERERN